MNLMNDIYIFLNVLAALNQNIQPLPFVELVEVLVASTTVNFAMKISILQLEFEGDCQRVISTINNHKPSNTMFGHIIDEIEDSIKTLQI